MASLKDLERDLTRALSGGDLEQIASVRRTIAEGFPDTPAAAEAHYRLGLDQLFRTKDMDAAANHLREAAKSKAMPWSVSARVSLGLIMFRQGKPQQAIFELRRVAGMKPPTIHSAQAAGFVVMALRESGNGAEADRARKQQLDLLNGLTKSKDAETAALAFQMLGMEHKFVGERAKAKEFLTKALASPALPPDERKSAETAMEDL
jgi:tetratricopeptide (TPR) repeat protein